VGEACCALIPLKFDRIDFMFSMFGLCLFAICDVFEIFSIF